MEQKQTDDSVAMIELRIYLAEVERKFSELRNSQCESSERRPLCCWLLNPEGFDNSFFLSNGLTGKEKITWKKQRLDRLPILLSN